MSKPRQVSEEEIVMDLEERLQRLKMSLRGLLFEKETKDKTCPECGKSEGFKLVNWDGYCKCRSCHAVFLVDDVLRK